MTTVFHDQEFKKFFDQDSRRTFSDLEFRNCRFINCRISITKNPRRRSTIRDVRLIGCETRMCGIEAAIIEDAVVDGLKTNYPLPIGGSVFKHVVLKGDIGRLMIDSTVLPGKLTEAEQEAFDEANAAYYASVDWALDISEARFRECDLRDIPAKLVRRDPATQVIVKREKALLESWRQLDLSSTYWATSLEIFLRRGSEDIVLVAPKSDPQYKRLLAGLMMLRETGVAEPD
jgi:hypothetical protein